MANAYKILIRRPERNTPLGKPRRRWILGKIGLEVVD
jgi:hypothetical protein